jgi:hypothetical protein
MGRTRATDKRGLSLRKPPTRAPARYYFSDNRHQFHNATPPARAALLDGPPRLVAAAARPSVGLRMRRLLPHDIWMVCC